MGWQDGLGDMGQERGHVSRVAFYFSLHCTNLVLRLFLLNEHTTLSEHAHPSSHRFGTVTRPKHVIPKFIWSFPEVFAALM
jgi:hypothetical protein